MKHRRSVFVQVRMRDNQRDQYNALAAVLGVPLAQLIRSRLDELLVENEEAVTAKLTEMGISMEETTEETQEEETGEE